MPAIVLAGRGALTCEVIAPARPPAEHERIAHLEGDTMQDVIERYLDCWNETDPDARRKLIEEVWAPDATYTDPLAEVSGRDAIDATIAAVQGQFPGFVFTLAGPVDAHHRQARFSWNLAPEGAEPVVIGFDVALTGPDGQIVAVFGFLDRVPAA
jgi:hypothetical protein